MPRYIVRVQEARIASPAETLRMRLSREPESASERASILADRAMRRLYGAGEMFFIRESRCDGLYRLYLIGQRCHHPRRGDASLAFDGPTLRITIEALA